MAGSVDIVAKLWKLCDVLKDDGVSYQNYVTELTYILFLKMLSEKGQDHRLPERFRWEKISKLEGTELYDTYRQMLLTLGSGKDEKGNDLKIDQKIKQIYSDSHTTIKKPKHLHVIFESFNNLDWYSVDKDHFGDLYEGLLEKNANETKSGAGQYFTPRPLIDCMVRLMKPQKGELVQDPAAGTAGFLIAADAYIKNMHGENYFSLKDSEYQFQRDEAFYGMEVVHETHRLALMNMLLHDIEGDLRYDSTLSSAGSEMRSADLILTNPPFGASKGGGSITRDDFTISTNNKQLCFLQHIYRNLKPGGRAAVVLPDIIDNHGAQVFEDLMNKCDLHTVLRLPTGIFYSQGVKTNVLFFTKGVKETGNTKNVWIYDLRSNMRSFGKTNPLKEKDLEEFEKLFGDDPYGKTNRKDQGENGRFRKFSHKDIEDNKFNLDISWLKDETQVVLTEEDLPSLLEDGSRKIESILNSFTELVSDLNTTSGSEEKDNWVTTDMIDIGQWGSGGTPLRSRKDFYGGSIPWLKSGDLNNSVVTESSEFITELGLSKSSAKIHPKGSVSIAMYGATVGKIGLLDIDSTTNQAVASVQTNEICNNKYLFYYLMSQKEELIRKGKGAAQPNISQEILKAHPIPLPPIKEQDDIVELLSEKIEMFNEMEAYLKETLSSLETMKELYLKNAFRGKFTDGKGLESVEEKLFEIRESRSTTKKNTKKKKVTKKKTEK